MYLNPVNFTMSWVGKWLLDVITFRFFHVSYQHILNKECVEGFYCFVYLYSLLLLLYDLLYYVKLSALLLKCTTSANWVLSCRSSNKLFERWGFADPTIPSHVCSTWSWWLWFSRKEKHAKSGRFFLMSLISGRVITCLVILQNKNQEFS